MHANNCQNDWFTLQITGIIAGFPPTYAIPYHMLIIVLQKYYKVSCGTLASINPLLTQYIKTQPP